MISGYLLKIKQEGFHDFGKYLKKRFRSLMYPYVTVSLLATVLDFGWKCVQHMQWKDVVIDDVLNTISLKGITTLWFLPTLFLAEIFFFFIHDSKAMKCIVACLSLIVPKIYSVFVHEHFGMFQNFILILFKKA